MTPKLHTIIYKLPEEIVLNTNYSQITGEMDLGELFRASIDQGNCVFVHEESVRKWLSFICGNYEAVPGSKNKDVLKNLNHILWVLPSKESCNALYALLQTSEEAKAIKEKYSIINCYDSSFSSREMIIAKIDTTIGSEPKESRTLTLTNQHLIKDIQRPYWSGIFMLRNFGLGGNADFSKIADLASMPWPVDTEQIKKESYLISFSYKRALILTNNRLRKEYSKKYFSEDVDSFKKFIRQSIKSSPIEYWGLERSLINENEIYEADPKESRSLWTSHRLIDFKALAEFIKDKSHKKALKVSGKNAKKELEDAVKTVQGINSGIPTFLYLMEDKNVPLVEYIRSSIENGSYSTVRKRGSRRKLSPHDKEKMDLFDFESITHVSPSLFLELADNGVIIPEAIDRLACDFRASEIVPFISSKLERARSICPRVVGLVFNSMPWPDFKYQYKEVDAWDKLLDNLCGPENENEDSIRTITMLLCYLQLLRPKIEFSPDDENSFNIDTDALTEQFLRVVSVKEDVEDIMSEVYQKDAYGLWVYSSESSVLGINEEYKGKLKETDYLNNLIQDVGDRSERMREHYNSSHTFNRYQRANEEYYSDDNCILLNVPQGEDELVIKEGTIVIGRNAFLNCTQLTRVVFPKSIQIIEEGAFHGCKKLEAIEFDGYGLDDWQTRFDKQIKKVALNSFKDSGLSLEHKDFVEKQYWTKPFFYQSSEAPNSVKVWCVDEDGLYTDANAEKHQITSEERVIDLRCIHSNFKDNEANLKAVVKNFLLSVKSDSERFYDVAPIYLSGTEEEKKELKRLIAYLFCAKENALRIGNLRFDEDFYKLIGRVADEKVSKSSVGGTIYLSFDVNSENLNNADFAAFLKVYYSKRENVRKDLVHFCEKANIGMTFYPNTGVFIDDDAEDPAQKLKVEMNSYTIKIIYVSSSKLDSIAEELCKTYYQRSVLVEDEINNRAYFKKHPLIQPNMDTLERDNKPLYDAFMEYLKEKENTRAESQIDICNGQPSVS